MDKSLKEITIPFLREQDFKGSFPHFRRYQDDRNNLLTFQFSLYAPQFVVEIANCPSSGIVTNWREVKPAKCTAHDMFRRSRLGGGQGDHWFDFSKTSIFANVYKKQAKEIIKLWDVAEQWWQDDPFEQRFAEASKE